MTHCAILTIPGLKARFIIPALTKGYIESYNDGTYPWLEGIQVTGFTWFEHLANLEIADSLTSSVFHAELEQISVFPNPANQSITVDGISLREIELWSASGKLIKRSFSNPFSVTECGNGLYILKIKTDKAAFFYQSVYPTLISKTVASFSSSFN